VSEAVAATAVESAMHDLLADVDKVDNMGRSPLHLALAAGRAGSRLKKRVGCCNL
jgi:hypothetical protein